MQRDDNSRFLLFIEPTLSQKAGAPINDEWTMIMRVAVSEAKLGTSNYTDPPNVEPWFKEKDRYKGVHYCCDDIESGNYDLLLPNDMITNTLAIHYLTWYRQAVPPSDWKKLEEIQRFYGRSKDQDLMSRYNGTRW